MAEPNKPPTAAPLSGIVMRPEWLRAIAKAASSLRFTANNWERATESCKQASREIADMLTEIENAMLNGQLQEIVEEILESSLTPESHEV